jgi:hypothetical protein
VSQTFARQYKAWQVFDGRPDRTCQGFLLGQKSLRE